jgi:hypothetical protein
LCSIALAANRQKPKCRKRMLLVARAALASGAQRGDPVVNSADIGIVVLFYSRLEPNLKKSASSRLESELRHDS